LRYPWPGNIRELQHLIERSVILSNGHGITFSFDTLSSAHDRCDKGPSSSSLADIEREHIERVLNNTLWRVKGQNGAAFILKLKPSTLYTRMKKLGIRRPDRLST
jgi:DNA-binding NtrC family response regulator